MECSHSQTSQKLGTSQTQSHSTFSAHGMQPLTSLTNTWDFTDSVSLYIFAHGMQPLTNLTNTWDFTDSVSLYILGSWNAATHKHLLHLGLYRLSLTVDFRL